MRLVTKFTFLAVFCGLFLLASVAGAQVPADKSDKTDKADKADKTDKSNKPTDNANAITLEDLAVEFPDVEGWEKDEIHKYPTAELGMSVNYESRQGGRVTLYIYNGGKKNIPNDINDKIIQGEFNASKSEIKKFAEMGLYESVSEIKNDTITLGGTSGKVKALRTVYTIRAGGRALTSEIYMFGYDNRFIKIRATRPLDKGDGGNTAVNNLLAEIDAAFSK